MSTLSSIAMDVNSLAGHGSPLASNHQPDLMGSATVMDRIHYYQPPSSGGEYGYYGNYAHKKGGGKRSVALTALTLLAFLFFLHILQSCIQEQSDMMNPQVVIMQARLRAAQREAEANKRVGEVAEALVKQQLKGGSKTTENLDKRPHLVFNDNDQYQYPKLSVEHVPLKTIQRTNK